MFVRNTWYPVMWSKDLSAGTLLARRVLDEPLVFFRDEGGHARALVDACPHRQAPLHMGKLVDGCRVQCGYHGLEFDGQGACVHNPHGEGKIPSAMRAKAYPVVERSTIAWIWMGDKRADESLIPDFSLMEEGDSMARARDSIGIEANYLLIADNLLDLGHANYLHDGILGFPEHGKAEIVTAQKDGVITCKRWMPDVPVAKLHDLMFRQDGQRIDMWNEVTWMAPSCLKLKHGFSRPGNMADSLEFTAVHLLTPETRTSTHYSYGIVRTPAKNEPELQKAVAETRRYVFEEQDRVVLEAQQRMLDEPSLQGMRPVLISVDAASTRMRRSIDSMLAAETTDDVYRGA